MDEIVSEAVFTMGSSLLPKPLFSKGFERKANMGFEQVTTPSVASTEHTNPLSFAEKGMKRQIIMQARPRELQESAGRKTNFPRVSTVIIRAARMADSLMPARKTKPHMKARERIAERRFDLNFDSSKTAKPDIRVT